VKPDSRQRGERTDRRLERPPGVAHVRSEPDVGADPSSQLLPPAR
jgi:hypothetical protein